MRITTSKKRKLQKFLTKFERGCKKKTKLGLIRNQITSKEEEQSYEMIMTKTIEALCSGTSTKAVKRKHGMGKNRCMT